MKNRNTYRRCRILIFVAASLCLITAAQGQISDIDAGQRLEPGLAYLHHRIGTGPLSIHVIKVKRDHPGFAFTTSLAQGTVLGLESVSHQVQALDPNLGHALVAVNGDFFRIRSGPYQGDPRGLQICQGQLVSSPHTVSFWIDAHRQPHIGQVQAAFHVTWPDRHTTPFALNQEPGPGEAVLFTPRMGSSTRTSSGTALVLERHEHSPWVPIRPGQVIRARVVSVSQDPNTTITASNLVLHISPDLLPRLSTLEPGMVLSLAFDTTPDLRGVTTAIGGGPVLIRNGQAQAFTGAQPRHPRTALGWSLTDYVLLVVDGRQKDLSIGMTFPELADFMLSLGCVEAINLDGGGSSTLWLNGRIMNSPSDGQERRVANGLVLLHKNTE